MNTTHRARRPKSIIGLAIVLLVYGVLTILYFALRIYFGGSANLAMGPELLPPAIGIVGVVAAIGVLRARLWAQILALLTGTAIGLGGLVLLWIAYAERGMPGSFAVLFIPPGILAVAIAAFTIWAALTNRAYFRHTG